ncbi:hypothetical protein ACH3XW_5790 [Acanthocheilonema viteae]
MEKELTTRPSPLPKSTRGETLVGHADNAVATFCSCCGVAGTYGMQILRKAGVTNGIHTAVTATALVATVPAAIIPASPI